MQVKNSLLHPIALINAVGPAIFSPNWPGGTVRVR